ncbi:hypothetical protein CYMTET_45632 [Cymbomonas tetramitiformis]|uniref:Uncharacterized protein n=1 Tax=Cymbomonas tetramitiformis TaxID=36881 RepID=A0AAE0BWX3_9CHLO|nr:hypothetical protein CYMTET_47082 [Cymbomonas tetramitiformis]KAK3244770.1 hypothetical protein CYMTET_45632 [Cymbomonas tetramitiformis]
MIMKDTKLEDEGVCNSAIALVREAEIEAERQRQEAQLKNKKSKRTSPWWAYFKEARKADIDEKLCYWVAAKKRPVIIVKDEELRLTLKDITRGAYQPPDHTKAKKEIARMAHKGMVSCTTDIVANNIRCGRDKCLRVPMTFLYLRSVGFEGIHLRCRKRVAGASLAGVAD